MITKKTVNKYSGLKQRDIFMKLMTQYMYQTHGDLIQALNDVYHQLDGQFRYNVGIALKSLKKLISTHHSGDQINDDVFKIFRKLGNNYPNDDYFNKFLGTLTNYAEIYPFARAAQDNLAIGETNQHILEKLKDKHNKVFYLKMTEVMDKDDNEKILIAATLGATALGVALWPIMKLEQHYLFNKHHNNHKD